MAGPLTGVRIIELVGLGPGPFCGMMLADMGAEVISVEKPSQARTGGRANDPTFRSRRSIAVDLKAAAGRDIVLRLIESADGLFEGFRPGVAERLGLGPDACQERNRRLVYGRITGWGQEGPLAHAAGHDLNYIALAGALHAIGSKGGRPIPPLNLVGDFGGGGMLLAFGMVCALYEAQRSGKGHVVNAAMIDGAAALMAMFAHFQALGLFDGLVGTHFLSGAAHFYGTYETKDGKYVSIAAIEPQFYDELIETLGLDRSTFGKKDLASFIPGDGDETWSVLQRALEEVFKTKSRDEWCALLEGTDVCFAPVLTLGEAPHHPHNAARQTFIDLAGVMQGAPAPRFSRTAPARPEPARQAGADAREILRSNGFDAKEIDRLIADGVISRPA